MNHHQQATMTSEMCLSLTPKRQTFQEAYNSVIATSQIQLVCDGTLAPSQWSQAIKQDIDSANKFFDNFIEDLNVICKAKNRKLIRKSQLTLNIHWSLYPDQLERAKVLRDEFKFNFYELKQKILSNIKCNTVRRKTQESFLMPLSWAIGENNIKSFDWADGPYKVTHRQMVDCAYKSPDDFTRKIPDDVTDILALLERTHYDYRPVILDGTLVCENIVQIIAQDPALVLQIMPKYDLIVSYWKEPFDSLSTEDWSYVWAAIIIPSAIVLAFGSGSAASWLLFNCGLLGAIFGILAGIVCVGSILVTCAALADYFTAEEVLEV